MKIEFIANASFLITFKNGKTLLTDPWFENSCFYGAWHNWPPLVDKEKYYRISPDYIYISHIHQDHLHPPTLNKFSKDTKILIVKQNHHHLKNKLHNYGYHNVIEFDEKVITKFEDLEFVFFKDFAPTSFGVDDGIGYEMDSSFLVKDTDGTSVFNGNDNPIQATDAKEIVEKYGSPTVSILPASGASMYPHSFLNFSYEEKLNEKNKLAEKMVDKFCEVAAVFKSKFVIPAAGSYVMAGAISAYSEFLHQPTQYLLESKWRKNKISDAKLVYFYEGDFIDTDLPKVEINEKAWFRNFNESDRLDYALSLGNVKLPHERVTIPEEFEFDWKKLLPRARSRLWQMQEKLNQFPNWDVVIEATGQYPCHFVFPYDQNKSSFDPTVRFNEKRIKFVIDSKLLLLDLIQMAHWNNIEIAALVQVERVPNTYEPAIHNLMSYFQL